MTSLNQHKNVINVIIVSLKRETLGNLINRIADFGILILSLQGSASILYVSGHYRPPMKHYFASGLILFR